MIDKDFKFSTEEYVCEQRATAVIIKDGKLLVQHNTQNDEYILPGGHLKIGESSVDAVVRECKEELGADIEVKRLLWTEERFKDEGVQLHHTSFYYLVELCGKSIVLDTDKFVPSLDCPTLTMGWLPLDKLGEIHLTPVFVKNEVFRLNEPQKHFITKTLMGNVTKILT